MDNRFQFEGGNPMFTGIVLVGVLVTALSQRPKLVCWWWRRRLAGWLKQTKPDDKVMELAIRLATAVRYLTRNCDRSVALFLCETAVQVLKASTATRFDIGTRQGCVASILKLAVEDVPMYKATSRLAIVFNPREFLEKYWCCFARVREYAPE
jgi:hypothetical protein